MIRTAFVLAVINGIAVLVSSDAKADTPCPVVVTMSGRASVRIQLAEGNTIPCDSSHNRMLFDGWITPGSALNTQINGACVCVCNTVDSFPRNGWSPRG